MHLRIATLLLLLAAAPAAHAQFDLVFSFSPFASFSTDELAILQDAATSAEAQWESLITGYQAGISQTTLTINITSTSSGLAFGRVDSYSTGGGFRYTTAGTILINPTQINAFYSWPDNGLNFWDDIMAHEACHVLGFGNHWVANGVYTNGTGQYTGAEALAAYQQEFDPSATFVPVELRGAAGTPNVHWDQIMRSDSIEGYPADPWSISPLTGITDSQGRDLALELMTGALDPDYGKPFLSMTTVYSLRDMGFTTVPEPSTAVLLLCGTICCFRPRRR